MCVCLSSCFVCEIEREEVSNGEGGGGGGDVLNEGEKEATDVRAAAVL